MPKKSEEEKIRKTIIYVPEDQHRELRHLAVDEDTSMTELIRQAIAEYLKNRKKRK